jgi:hypothetical protein
MSGNLMRESRRRREKEKMGRGEEEVKEGVRKRKETGYLQGPTILDIPAGFRAYLGQPG